MLWSPSNAATCCICLDIIQGEAFSADGCNDTACQACLAAYLHAQLDVHHDSYERIPCPHQGCTSTFEAVATVPRILTPTESAHHWWRRVIELTIMDSVGYCPYRDCGASFELFAEDDRSDNVYATCFECSRGICLRCEAPWHRGKTCDDNEHETRGPAWKRHEGSKRRRRRRDREHSVQALQLAKTNSWTRCPYCRFMVEKQKGCNTVVCACKREFCYRCGSPSSNHQCARACHNLSKAELLTVRESMFRYEDPMH